MDWLSRLLIVVVLCLIATLALPTPPTQAACPPYSIQLSPKSGTPGTVATISGHDFQANKLVDIYYDGTRIATTRTDRNGNFLTTFTTPEGCAGQYKVLVDVGYTSIHTYFTVKPGLTIIPEKGPVGTTVTVTGRGFAKNEDSIELRYYLNDNYVRVQERINANARGSWQTSFQIPLSNRGQHKIDAEGAVSKHFEVKDAIFRITAEITIDRPSVIAGDTITMTGSRFGPYEKGIKILFAGTSVKTDIQANSEGEWQASFAVPEMPGGNYTVTAEGDQTRKEDIMPVSFEIKPGIVLSPTEGHVGMNLSVTGRGFATDSDVVINYDGRPVAAARTNSKGSFETTFAVPNSQHGERLVTAGYSADNAASAIFTMESDPPPVPSLVSPTRGSRLGLWGGAKAIFQWSEVFDDSGVRYSLQLATSADFGASSVIVSVAGLMETTYTATRALPNGTYYWRVQAIDGGENESDWSAAHSFRVGLLPKWVFILAITLVAVALLTFLVRALVRTRSIYYDRW